MVLVISVTASLIWLIFIKRFETSPCLTGKPSVIVYMFLLGLGSTIVALYLGEINELLFSQVVFLSPLTYNVLYVGLCEEFGKFLVFYIIASQTDITKEPKDGLLQATAVALGFAVLENVIYSGYGIGILLYRSVMTVAGHMSFAVIWGYAAGLYLFSKRAGRNEYGFGMVLGAVCTTAIFHGLYNYFLYLDLMLLSLLLDAVVLSISIYLLRLQRGKSPYTSADENLVKEAMCSNPDNFQLNRQAGLQALEATDYNDALVWFRKASGVNRREISTKVFIVFSELMTGSVSEFEAYRKLDRICGKLSVYNLYRLKERTGEVFSSCIDKERLLTLIDDLIEDAGSREFLKRRRAEFDKMAVSAGTVGAGDGFMISDKDCLPLAYRHPAYYKDR